MAEDGGKAEFKVKNAKWRTERPGGVTAHSTGQGKRKESLSKSALEHVIAHRLPAVNEILFLRASSPLARVTIVGMEMRRAGRQGILQLQMTLQPLMQIPSLRNVDGNPVAVLGLFGINVKAGQGFESSANGIDCVLILPAGLSGPVARGGRCAIRMRVTTE
jgi:hypothetical protein